MPQINNAGHVCQAVPRRVLQVEAARVEVDIDGAPTRVATDGTPGLRVGDYVVVYAGRALERIPEAEALDLLEIYAAMQAL